jgi:DNA polymerase III epsilon subunit family exonuclease
MARDHKGTSVLFFPDSYTVIDVESTGLDPQKDSLIEVAALRIRDFQVTDSFESLINPGFTIDSFISNLTGITNDDLAAAPDAKPVLDSLRSFIGNDIVVGHNVQFDINFLYDNFMKYLGVPMSNRYIDTLRHSRKYFPQAPSFALPDLCGFLEIASEVHHRALADCYATNDLYRLLADASKNPTPKEEELLSTLSYDQSNPFYGKRLVVKGIPQGYTIPFMVAVSEKCGAKLSDVFYKTCDYAVFSKFTFKQYQQGSDSEKFVKARELVEAGTLKVISEKDWAEMLGLPFAESSKSSYKPLNAKDITTENTEFDTTHPLYGKLCVFTGALERMTRHDAMQAVVDLGGLVGNSVTKKTNYLILGNNDYNPLVKGKSSKHKKAEELKLKGHDIEIISENVFYDLISEE